MYDQQTIIQLNTILANQQNQNRKNIMPYTSAAQQEWLRLYPDTPFPSRDTHPYMYATQATIIYDIVDYGDYQCTSANVCWKGLIDISCQLEHGCYINLAILAAQILFFTLFSIIFILIAGYSVRILYKIITYFSMIPKLLFGVSKCLQCLSFGFFDDRIYYHTKKQDQLTQTQKQIEKTLAKYNININFQRLDKTAENRIIGFIQDCEVIEDKK